jgi:predicted PurR-regulated permease PerM
MMSRMAERLVGWLRGTLLSMIIIGVISGVAFWLVGAPYPLLLGVFVGVIEIITVVGPWIGGATAVLITAFYDLQTALWVAVAIAMHTTIAGLSMVPFTWTSIRRGRQAWTGEPSGRLARVAILRGAA